MLYLFFLAIIVLCVYIYYNRKAEKQSSCNKHEMECVGFTYEHDSKKEEAYSVRTYKCKTCEYMVSIDTRHGDPYEKQNSL